MEEPSEADRVLQLQLRVGEFEKLSAELWDQLHNSIGEWIRTATRALAEPSDIKEPWLVAEIEDGGDLSQGDKLITYTVTMRDRRVK